MFRKALLSLVAATALAATSAHAGELVQNGGFETSGAPSSLFANWTVTGDGILDDTVFPNTGSHDAQFTFGAGDPGSPGVLSQSLGTTAAGNYTLTYSLMDEGPGTATGGTFDTFTVTFGSFTQTVTFGLTPSTPFAYQTFTALIPQADLSGPTTTLSFQGIIGDPNGAPGAFHLDDVSVTAGIPEPGSWLLMITGIGLAGAALRLRHARSQAAT